MNIKKYTILLFLLCFAGFKITAQTGSSKGQSFTITGAVEDRAGEPIIGATIMVKGTITGALTDIDGNYSIEASVGDMLEFRFIGYNSQEYKVRAQDRVINVTLEESNVNLDEVVVVGYGQQKKESVVASINAISSSELSLPQPSLSGSIAGRISGVIAIQRSGEPGQDAANFWIRGQSSYAGGTSALVLVDGVPRAMNDIDVDEIESFSVLKDAAATAVYGAEGANGVVLITSKRGRAQKTKVSFNAQYSFVRPTRLPKSVDSYDYLSMFNEASWNERGNPENFNAPYSDEVLNYYRTGVDPDLYPNVNWNDLLKRETMRQRYTINFRGGGEKTRFFVSAAFYDEDGIFKSRSVEGYDANIGSQRFNLRSNIDFAISNTTEMQVDISGQYKTRNNPGNSSSAIFNAITLFPVHHIPMMYSDGTSSDHELAAYDRYNPYNMLNHSGYTKRWDAQLQTKITLKQKLDFITEGLSIRGSLSFDADQSSITKRSKSPQTFYAMGRDSKGELIKKTIGEGSALGNPTTDRVSGSKRIYLEAALNYSRVFSDRHDVTGLFLFNQKEEQFQNRSAALGALPYRKQSVVARGTYAYDGRYLFEASFGASGSENFKKGNQWGVFPAVGGAWYISNEKFMQRANKYLNKLKLRVSFGVTGNDLIGASNRFPYREALAFTNGFDMGLRPGVGGNSSNSFGGGIIESTFAAPGLTWETEAKTNLGLDIGLFNNRIDIAVDWFYNRRKDILVQRRTIPTAAGFRKNPFQNFGITTNSGIDASMVLRHDFGDLTVSSRSTFTYAKNKVKEYDEIPQLYDYQTYTGRSIGTPLLYIAEGLYTPDDFNISKDQAGNHIYSLKDGLPVPAAQVAPGDIRYRDLNNDGIIDSFDRTYDHGIKPTNPQIVYGFGINFEYKGFFGGAFFQGVGKAHTNLLSKVQNFIPFYNGVDNSSARVEALNHWSAHDPYNQNVTFPRLRTSRYPHNTENSTWWYRDASFLRLKDVEFGYQFNKKQLQRFGMENLRIYVQGLNVALWDKIKYWDPELGGSNSGAVYPITGTWTIGLEVTF